MSISSSRKVYCKTILSILIPSITIISFYGDSQAQVVPDRTLGVENSIVTPNSDVKGIPSDRIDGGAIRGSNLFHSFQEFNVSEGRGIYFTSPVGVQSIFSRITGSNASQILGKLGTLGSSASLFLINPNGIIFGPNSTLDVTNSFVATTARSIDFADGTRFNAGVSDRETLLTVSVPISLRFDNPGNITVRGNGNGTRLTNNLVDTNFGLRILPEKIIALVGGNVIIDGGSIKSPGGKIEIGSVLEGNIQISDYNSNNFTFRYENTLAQGTVQLVRQSTIDASGFGAGDIFIQGQNLSLNSGSQIESSTLASELGGTVNINVTDTIEIAGTATKGNFITPSGISAFVYPNASGSGASLNVNTRRLVLRSPGTLSTATLGSGSGGNLTIDAKEIEVIGSLSNGRRSGGIATSVAPRATGKAGDLLINTRKLQVSNGGTVSTTSLGLGRPGNVFIGAETVELSGSAGETPSSLSARSVGIADSGNITVETQTFKVLDGARTSVRNDGSGNAGALQINASSIYLENQGSITASTASGKGGNISIQGGNLQLLRNSILTTSAGNEGEGGNIDISADTLTVINNSEITAEAIGGPGGNIQVKTQGIFRSPESEISASSELGIDGTVNIQTFGLDVRNSLVSLENNFVSSEQVVAGSCLARRNTDRSSFVVTGSGGLPLNPDSEIQEWESLSSPRTDRQKLEESRNIVPTKLQVSPKSVAAKKWKLGDPIIEAQGIIKLTGGRVMLGMKPQTPKNAESLICQS